MGTRSMSLRVCISVRAVRYRKDPGPDRNAAYWPGNLRDSRVFHAIVWALSDEDRFVRLSAIQALVKIEDNRTAAVLEKLVKDPDPVVRGMASTALKETSPSGETMHNEKADDAGKEEAVKLIEQEIADIGWGVDEIT